MSQNLVSVIMPVKNGSNYIKQALEAIKSQNVNLEIIVVDDGSSDDSAQIAASYGALIVMHEVNKGSVASKNSGLKIARGNYIIFHDHDDVMNDNALPQMLEELEKNREFFAVSAKLKDFFSPELSVQEKQKVVLRNDTYHGLFSGSALIRKEVFDIVGLFDESLQAGDIIDWSMKMSEKNLPIKKLDFVAANRRIHNCNYGRINQQKEFKDYATILRSKIKKTA